MDEQDTQPETAETVENTYVIKAYGGFALRVKDSKNKDYVEGYIRATLEKTYPDFQILNFTVEQVEK